MKHKAGASFCSQKDKKVKGEIVAKASLYYQMSIKRIIFQVKNELKAK